MHRAAPDIARDRQRGLTQWQPAIEAEHGNVDNYLQLLVLVDDRTQEPPYLYRVMTPQRRLLRTASI